jgi:hypothetical protein
MWYKIGGIQAIHINNHRKAAHQQHLFQA